MPRNAMSSAIEWAAPASTDPTRKIPMAIWKSVLRPSRSPSLPQTGVVTVEASR